MVYVRNFLDAYWEKVDVRGPDDCWEWTAARYHDDYGVLGIRKPKGGRTTMRAHAMALILATGEDAGDRFGLHSCDNPPCCNARHLRWDDQKRNVADALDRQRRARWDGEYNPRAKLTEQDVCHLRAAYASGMVFQRDLAYHYGVAQSIVSAVVTRKLWSHV